jgi:hypothetical protein
MVLIGLTIATVIYLKRKNRYAASLPGEEAAELANADGGRNGSKQRN